MAYTKTVWQDHIISTPNTYTVTQNGGTWTILPSEGTVIQSGTPVNAANLNKIEDELYTLDTGKMDKSIVSYSTDMGSTTSVADSTWTQVGSLTLAAGTYILCACGSFQSNSSGYRALAISLSSGTTTMDRFSWVRCAPATNAYTEVNFCKIQPVATSTTYYLNAYQTSGGALNVTAGLRALRIV